MDALFIQQNIYILLLFSLGTAMVMNTLFLIIDGLDLIAVGDRNLGWLFFLIVPVELCVLIVLFFIVAGAAF